jgi:hypothetical protein
MIWLSLFPLVCQGLAMFFDEFYFHKKRGLPAWERIGHPIDSLSVLVTIGIPVWVNFSESMLTVYVVMALFSSLLVTKDEFVHSDHCQAGENWLHAVLFVLHPLVFLSVGLLWYLRDADFALFDSETFVPSKNLLGHALLGQWALVLFFLTYQIVYWNFLWQKKH